MTFHWIVLHNFVGFVYWKDRNFMLGVTETLLQTLVTKAVLYITKVVIRSAFFISWATSNVKVFWTLCPYHGAWRRLRVILSCFNTNHKKNIIENAFVMMFFRRQTWVGKLLLFECVSLIKKGTVTIFLSKETMPFSCQ